MRERYLCNPWQATGRWRLGCFVQLGADKEATPAGGGKATTGALLKQAVQESHSEPEKGLSPTMVYNHTLYALHTGPRQREVLQEAP
jgi:hypothetical protein